MARKRSGLAVARAYHKHALAVVIGVATLVGTFGFVVPQITAAKARTSDMQCTKGEYRCDYPQKKKINGKMVQCMRNKPCVDMTNGHKTPGKCQQEMKCLGEPNKDDKPGGEPKTPELPKPPEDKPKSDQPQQPCPQQQTQGSGGFDLGSMLNAGAQLIGRGQSAPAPCPAGK